MFSALALSLLAAPPVAGAAPPLRPTDVPGLVCFWDFQSTPQGGPGADLTAAGPHGYTLTEMNGPIARVGGGPFGPAALRIERGQWLRIPRADCPALLLSGDDHVTVVAWVKRRADVHWQYIAGVWDELNAARQYALFTCGHRQADWRTLDRAPCERRAHGYVSDVGGATPGKPFCFSYATGATELPAERWAMIAFTYDGENVRVYHDGELDANPGANPFRWDEPIYEPPPGGPAADFTIAQRGVRTWPDYPEGTPGNEVGFGGDLGGVAVFRRALSPAEIRALHAGAAAEPE